MALERTAVSPTIAKSIVAKATRGNINELFVVLPAASATDRCAMVFNGTSVPANGAAPDWRLPVEGAKSASYTWAKPLGCPDGIVVVLSSTWDTLTIVAAAEAFFHVQFD